MKRYDWPRYVIGAATLGLVTLSVSALAQHAHEGSGARKPTTKSPASQYAAAHMPRIQEKGVLTVRGDENWEEITGFGKESAMTEMMTQMMVGGSGMENMKMAPMKPGMKMNAMMPGMKMGGMARGGTGPATGMPIAVTLAQNPPAVGENTLDVVVTDANGKPATGLKLMATVAMTSMDMGTERPKAIEGKDGHYSVPVKFSMKGPWRIVLMNDGKADKNSAVNATIDVNVDGKTKWIQPKSITDMKMASGGQGNIKDRKSLAGVNENVKDTKIPPAPSSDIKATPDVKPTPGNHDAEPVTKQVAGDQRDLKGAKPAAVDPADMKNMEMPVAGEPTGGYRVTVKSDPKTFKVGKNLLDIIILDGNGKPVTGAKVTGAVEMTSMDMGVTKPKAQEGKDGRYTLPAQFSMKGPWRVTLTVAPPKQKPFTKVFEFKLAR